VDVQFSFKTLSVMIHIQEDLSWFCTSQLCLFSRLWGGFICPLLLWISFPKSREVYNRC